MINHLKQVKMSTTRSVIIASQVTNRARKVNTSAKTWGELKAQSDVADLIVGSVEVIMNPGNVTLNRDTAVLPTTDFKLYVVPTKNKAGVVSDYDAYSIGQAITEAIKKASSLASQQEANNLKGALIGEIEMFFDVDLSENCDGCKEALAEASNF